MTDAARTAQALLAARRGPGRTPMDRLAEGLRPVGMPEATAAQHALAGLLGASHPAGFKIGATGRRMQEYLGLDGPAAGFMAEANLHGSGSTLSFDGFLRPGVECELAVHLAKDLPPGPCTPAQAADAVDRLMAGIELVENRYVDFAAFGTPALIADQVFHAAAILGEPDMGWRALDLPAITGRLTVDGVLRGEGQGSELLGDPMQALAWLAGSAEAAAFGGLRAGQVVMLGSVIPPIWLNGPADVEVTFPPLPPVKLRIV